MTKNKAEKKSAYDELTGLMADFSADYLEPKFKKQQAGEEHELPTDQTFWDIFKGFTEIGDSLDAIALIEELLRTPPPRRKAVRKDHYIKLLVGSYLQEMYILEQRMSAYGKKISRLYGVRSLPEQVQKIVYVPMENLINLRGAHVHQNRFSDENLDRVGMFALFESVGHKFGEHLLDHYHLAQISWAKQVEKNNKETRKIVDEYCSLFIPIVAAGGKIFLPSKAARLSSSHPATSVRPQQA